MSNNGYFIDDGYSRTVTIEATEHYPAVKLEFRPLLPRQVRAVQRSVRRVYGIEPGTTEAQALEAEAVLVDTICRQVTGWDIQHNGEVLKRSAENVQRLHGELQAAIWRELSKSAETAGADEKN